MSVFYKMNYDMKMYDDSVDEEYPYLYADKSNIDEIEANENHQRDIGCIDLYPDSPEPWPIVKFYYNSLDGTRESDFLGNVNYWVIVHERAMKIFKQARIEGISFHPIQLIDLVKNEIYYNKYYYMHIYNFIDAC